MKPDNDVLPILDRRALAHNFEGLPQKMVAQSIMTFLTEARRFNQDIVKQSCSQSQVKQHFHSLKTMSLMIGASRLASICAHFEEVELSQRPVVIECYFAAFAELEPILSHELTIVQ